MRTQGAWRGSTRLAGRRHSGWELGIATAAARGVLGQGWAPSLLGRGDVAPRRL